MRKAVFGDRGAPLNYTAVRTTRGKNMWSQRGRCMYVFSRAAVIKHHQPGHFKPQRFIFSQFWSPEFQNQGVGRARLPLKPTGRNPCPFSFPSISWPFRWVCCWLAHRYITSVSASTFTWGPAYVCPCPSLLIWTLAIGHAELRVWSTLACPMSAPHCICSSPIPRYSCPRDWGLEHQQICSGRGHNSAL